MPFKGSTLVYVGLLSAENIRLSPFKLFFYLEEAKSSQIIIWPLASPDFHRPLLHDSQVSFGFSKQSLTC